MSMHWKPPGRGTGFSWGEAGLTLLAGLLIGLFYVLASGGSWRGDPAAVAVPTAFPVPDPFAESRRSREILREQEDGPLPLTEPARPAQRAERIGAGDVVDVIDGDTFRYGSATIRIADIDTPEVNGRCAEESALAARATQRLAVLLAAGPFKIEPVERDTDRYGRKLRVVTRGGRSLGDQLVAEGLARTWTGRREPWCV